MKNTLSLLAASAALSLHAAAPSIPTGSVTMTQAESSRQVIITYDLQNAPAIVTVDILTNGVTIGAANLKYFAGDVHRVIQPGTGKRMTWRPDKAWPGHEITDRSVTAKVTAWALNAPPNIMVVDLVVPNQLDFYADVESLPGKDGVQNDLYKTDKMVFRKCPAANVTWRMGAPTTEPGYGYRQVAHLVTLSNDFYMGVYEMTQRQYERISGKSSTAYYSNKAYYATRPMESLTWAKMRMSDKDGTVDGTYSWPEHGHDVAPASILGMLRASVSQRVQFDLPTEAQWEFACRAGVGTGLYTGKEITAERAACANVAEIARYKFNSGYDVGTPAADCEPNRGTALVGSYKPNAWGFYDMCGNVSEYCLDYWKDDISDVDPETGSLVQKGNRSRRGGGLSDNPLSVRSAGRIEYAELTTVDTGSGFRLAALAEIGE